MRIISIADKEGSAIDRLCKMNLKRWPHVRVAHMCIHPKRPEPGKVEAFRKLLKTADIIDCAYWKTAVTLRRLVPEMEEKILILTHNNEHNVVPRKDGQKWGWEDLRWDAIVCKNGWQEKRLKEQGFDPILIRHACEFDTLSFIPELTEERVVGYVGQIKKVKGVRELKRACDELGYRLLVCGKASEGQYFEDLNKDNLIMASDVPDADMQERIWNKIRVFCCNSDDGTESGTLPILEAMVAGVPVVTRKVGHVRDFGRHEKNMMLREGGYTDIEELKSLLMLVMENDDIANELRENAWRTVRQYHPEVHAREYMRLFHRVMHPNTPIVSVIVPTFNRADVLMEKLESMTEQTYPNFEVVVCDDGSDDNTRGVVEQARDMYDFPIRYVNTGRTDGYNLATARNLGVIEALGDILVFCDDRLKMHPNAVSAFVGKLENMRTGKKTRKVWAWGSKGCFKSFVENFSATYRRTLIEGGMFCERIDEYGGMTQEVSARFGSQGVHFDWCPEAVAEPMMATHSKSKNRDALIRMKIRLYKMGLQ